MAKFALVTALLFLVGCSSSAPNTGAPDSLKALIGEKGGAAELSLRQAGYEHRNTVKTESSSISRWRGKDGGCIEVTTADGRFSRIMPADAGLCVDDGSALPPSGEATAMRTVCGVIVAEKTSRYLCEVEENRQGTTKLKMPDTNIQLVWKPGGKVEFLQEGAAAIDAKYVESEGETDIIVDARTFFYVSNPQAAALEVKNFKP
jgi:hypothetical protein